MPVIQTTRSNKDDKNGERNIISPFDFRKAGDIGVDLSENRHDSYGGCLCVYQFPPPLPPKPPLLPPLLPPSPLLPLSSKSSKPVCML